MISWLKNLLGLNGFRDGGFTGRGDFGSSAVFSGSSANVAPSNPKGCGRSIVTDDPYSSGKCGFQYMPNEQKALCIDCGGQFKLA